VVRLALRVHTDLGADSDVAFAPPQDRIRDALDAILAFFGRLESAIANGFVDEAPAMRYFGYWLKKMYTMSEHQGAGADVQEKMRAYEDAYGPGKDIMGHLYGRMKQYYGA
jgi:hypothetical protein